MMEKTISDPVDSFHATFLVFKLLGMATLLPWSFFVSVSGYWMHKFRDVSTDFSAPVADGLNKTVANDMNQSGNIMDDLTPLQTKWSSYLSIASMLPNVLVLLLNAAVGHRFRLLPRIFISLVLVVLLFLLTCIMTQINSDQWQHAFLNMTLVTVVAINATVAISQGGLSSLAAKFPPRYMGAVVQGQALGGIFAAATNVIFLALDTSHVDAAFWCFLVAILFISGGTAAFYVLTKSPFFEHFCNQRDLSQEEEKMLSEKNIEWKTKDDKNVNVLRIAKEIYLWIAAVFVNFAVSLTIFPALTVLVVSEDYGKGHLWNDRFFTPVGCFLLFSIGDYAGRVLAGISLWPGPTPSGSLTLLMLSVLRVCLVPLFLFCNASPNNRLVTSVVFRSDFIFLLLVALLSLSNGYIGSIAMMFAPKSVEGDAHVQSAVASLMVAFLVLGLACGSIMSLGILMLL